MHQSDSSPLNYIQGGRRMLGGSSPHHKNVNKIQRIVARKVKLITDTRIGVE